MIETDGLTHAYGAKRAVDGATLEVPSGSVVGLLGPNGAGKTTIVRILATLLPADSGRASVGGHDVRTDAYAVRSMISLTGQDIAIDETLSGAENLTMIGWLLGLGRREARDRSRELLESFDLADAGRKLTRSYSGGMRRRLDLAASLVGRPRVLFLDEPTTGLDPRSRLALWDVIRALVAEGTTVLLTTQYLDEADALADAIAVIDRGRVVAHGSARQLKAQVGGGVLVLRPAHPRDIATMLSALAGFHAVAVPGESAVAVPVDENSDVMTSAVRRIDDLGVRLTDLNVRRPSLDDVFLALTGHATDPNSTPGHGLRTGREESDS
ncbi:MAG: daunorubicin/doxorubicin resistance ABC transporter ATP-binding protein DrrA [Micrococcales bacterium]|nr:MAG: daunorubicin/doxorubicin resistance ABC transporter ATP-binding protein DrrA [Micrococcales bacterium]PIE25832.1 MAG: daunorubicin/doxorubicin resistance ABC transporter ATP-binding protein DrrA [Micrococcales bacterium]